MIHFCVSISLRNSNLPWCINSYKRFLMLKSIFLLLVFPLLAFSQSQVTNDEISKKLDLILQKVSDLEQRVVKLESASVEVRQEVQDVAKSAEEAKKSIQSIPQEPEQKKSFLQSLGNQLKHSKPSNPAPGQKRLPGVECENLSSLQVRKLLGNPTKIKKSINPRIDQMFIYSGDLDADGGEDQGIVNFYRNRVVNFESPFE